MIEPDSLLQALKMATDMDYWDSETGGSLEYVDSGYLLVLATPKMHRAVDRALSGLR